jgi:hypothetical protein
MFKILNSNSKCSKEDGYVKGFHPQAGGGKRLSMNSEQHLVSSWLSPQVGFLFAAALLCLEG